GLSLALEQFDRPGESEAIRSAFRRGVEAKLATPPGTMALSGPIAPAPLIQSWSAVPPKMAPPKIEQEPTRFVELFLAASAIVLASIAAIKEWRTWEAAPPVEARIERQAIAAPAPSTPGGVRSPERPTSSAPAQSSPPAALAEPRGSNAHESAQALAKRS